MPEPSPTHPPGRSGRLILVALVTLGLLARLALALMTGDGQAAAVLESLEYLAIGDAVLSGQGFVLPEASPAGPVTPGGKTRLAARMPGYPLLVGASRAVAAESMRGILVCQALCGTATVVVVFWMARRLAGFWAGLVGAALLVFDPYQVYFSVVILPEVPMGLALGLAVAAGLKFLDAVDSAGQRPWLWAALAGLALAAAAYLEPAAAVMAIPAGAAATVAKNRRRLLAGWAVAMVVILAALTPWLARNWVQLGRPLLTSDLGVSLYAGTLGPGTGETGAEGVEPVRPPEGLDEAREDLFYLGEAAHRATTAPAVWLRQAAWRALWTWSPAAILAEAAVPLPPLAGWTSLLPMAVLALAGAWSLAWRRRAALVWLLVPAVSVTLAYALFVGPVWDRLAAMPALAALGGAGLVAILGREPRKENADD